jgi:hypothetical protein
VWRPETNRTQMSYSIRRIGNLDSIWRTAFEGRPRRVARLMYQESSLLFSRQRGSWRSALGVYGSPKAAEPPRATQTGSMPTANQTTMLAEDTRRLTLFSLCHLPARASDGLRNALIGVMAGDGRGPQQNVRCHGIHCSLSNAFVGIRVHVDRQELQVLHLEGAHFKKRGK